MNKITIMLIALLVSGCQSVPVVGPKNILFQEVKTPVRASCVPKTLSPKEEFPDTDQKLLQAPGADERYRLLIAGRELRQARLNDLEPVLEDCARE